MRFLLIILLFSIKFCHIKWNMHDTKVWWRGTKKNTEQPKEIIDVNGFFLFARIYTRLFCERMFASNERKLMTRQTIKYEEYDDSVPTLCHCTPCNIVHVHFCCTFNTIACFSAKHNRHWHIVHHSYRFIIFQHSHNSHFQFCFC